MAAPVLDPIAEIRVQEWPSPNAYYGVRRGKFTASDADDDTIKFTVEGAVKFTLSEGYTHRVESFYAALTFNENTGKFWLQIYSERVNSLDIGTYTAARFVVRATAPKNDDPTVTEQSAPKNLLFTVAAISSPVRFTDAAAQTVETLVENTGGTEQDPLIIAQVPAQDTTESGKTIVYYLEEEPDGFEIDQNGEITYTGRGLNYEAIEKDADGKAFIQFFAIAYIDQLGVSQFIIRIEVTDEDEPLVFSTNTLTLLENRDGTATVRMQAILGLMQMVCLLIEAPLLTLRHKVARLFNLECGQQLAQVTQQSQQTKL